MPESGSIVVNRQFLDALQARLFSSGIVCEEPGDIHRAFTTLIDIKIFAWDDSGTNLIKRGKNGN
ncbi:MAG TPA: hypothetical protein V6C58_28330 [Allocoleopsis sp.]